MLASLVLLGILSTSVLAIFITAASWVQQARQQTTATNFAATVLENLRADPSKVIAENNGKTADDEVFAFDIQDFTDKGMTATINIVKYDDPDDNLPLLTVNVIVTDNQGCELLPGGLCTVMRREDS